MHRRMFVLAAALLAGCGSRSDPLPSWHEGPSGQSILRFVNDVTTDGNSDGDRA